MGTDPKQFFENLFARLTRRPPYPWQRKLFLEIVAGSWPQVVNLPTGSGKTAVLHIWLLALAWSFQNRTDGVPRRLAWVVNRRVVVDQVTSEVEELVEPGGQLDQCPELREVLARASLSGDHLAVSTLRGQRADNGDWARDPSTPAVVIGTVDMIGSRLLFRGYRCGPYYRPIHAGLLGLDTLIVNDESHLSPAFARLLEEIHAMNPAARLPGKCFRVLLLSATPSDSALRVFDHDPAEDAAESETFRQVFEAPKTIALHEVETKAVESTMYKLATENLVPRTVLFIEEPEKAAKFLGRLPEDRSALLTGTMRGFERDQLVSRTVFQRFLRSEPGSEPVWLVSTSAGEVGINLTCERMVTGLVEADHLAQRFGRLNRFGSGLGEAHVVHAAFKNDKLPPKEDRRRKTLEYLRTLGSDISCRSIWQHKLPAEASEPLPAMARLEERLIETWAQTTYKDKHVPRIEKWLHGKQESDAPEAEVAWRADVAILTDWNIADEQIEKILDRYPVGAQERLREPAKRVLDKLAEIAKQLGEAEASTFLIQVESDRTVKKLSLTAVVKNEDIDGKLLLLPEKLGNIDKGMFRAEEASEETIFDVADKGLNRSRFCFDAGVPVRVGDYEGPSPGGPDRNSLALFAREMEFKAPLVIRHPDEEDKLLVYFGEASALKGKLRDVSLEKHRLAVEEKARALAASVGLETLAGTFARAGALHDEGKWNPLWQRAMGGCMETPLAKSKAAVHPRLINGYRHELGSILKAASETDDLLLHLIASHHAGGRPYFEEKQFDREALKKSAAAALESARRFARLQNQLGPWGLAYLESVFKRADGLVSAEEGEPASE